MLTNPHKPRETRSKIEDGAEKVAKDHIPQKGTGEAAGLSPREKANQQLHKGFGNIRATLNPTLDDAKDAGTQ